MKRRCSDLEVVSVSTRSTETYSNRIISEPSLEPITIVSERGRHAKLRHCTPTRQRERPIALSASTSCGLAARWYRQGSSARSELAERGDTPERCGGGKGRGGSAGCRTSASGRCSFSPFAPVAAAIVAMPGEATVATQDAAEQHQGSKPVARPGLAARTAMLPIQRPRARRDQFREGQARCS